MNRSGLFLLACLFVPTCVHAQITVDVPVELSGPNGLRGIDGIGPPVEGSSAITVEGAVLNTWNWAQATMQADTIALLLTPGLNEQRNGLLIRFVMPTDGSGELFIRAGTFSALPLHRPDGLAPVKGQLVEGLICEIVHVNGVMYLVNALEEGCPPGTLSVHAHLCIEADSYPGLLFFDAATRCHNAGGRLCAWDEYYAACTLLGPSLTGMFNEWEWLDETANHTHTAVQVGRYTCGSQRSQGVLQQRVGETRCCFYPR